MYKIRDNKLIFLIKYKHLLTINKKTRTQWLTLNKS